MANRHLSRSLAMQSLFEWDFYQTNSQLLASEGKAKSIDSILERNIEEFGPGLEDGNFARELTHGVIEHQQEIDDIIQKAAPEWPINHIAPVDRNILRIGLLELLFRDKKEVPPKVAINESIELAKTFGGETSGKFVNGVLGTVFRELGLEEQNGEEYMSSKQRLEKLPKEELVGAVLFRKEGAKDVSFALVHDVFGYWTFSKGHLNPGEDLKICVARTVKEELGVGDVSVLEKIGENEYIASDPKTGPTRRHVSFFLAETKDVSLTLDTTGGLDDARWFSQEEAIDVKMYPDIRPILELARDVLGEKIRNKT